MDLARLAERLPGRRIVWLETIDSTMIAALRFARDGCPSGTIVGAEEQTAGTGRHGHSWHSEAGTGLYASMVLRLPGSVRTPPVVMLALGLAVQQAIVEVTSLVPDLRWPNDVLVQGRKCAGVLAQIEDQAIVAGIGINVSQTRFPTELAATATSLGLSGSGTVSREELLVSLARAVDEYCRVLIEGADGILNMFTRASSYAMGRRVRVDEGGSFIEGVTCGLDSSGFLLVRQDNGRVATILAGGVRPV
jgi:BirA family biotin operon repressor/biotin-[acetyl-CoA-carboxylase] ligase